MADCYRWVVVDCNWQLLTRVMIPVRVCVSVLSCEAAGLNKQSDIQSPSPGSDLRSVHSPQGSQIIWNQSLFNKKKTNSTNRTHRKLTIWFPGSNFWLHSTRSLSTWFEVKNSMKTKGNLNCFVEAARSGRWSRAGLEQKEKWKRNKEEKTQGRRWMWSLQKNKEWLKTEVLHYCWQIS